MCVHCRCREKDKISALHNSAVMALKVNEVRTDHIESELDILSEHVRSLEAALATTKSQLRRRDDELERQGVVFNKRIIQLSELAFQHGIQPIINPDDPTGGKSKRSGRRAMLAQRNKERAEIAHQLEIMEMKMERLIESLGRVANSKLTTLRVRVNGYYLATLVPSMHIHI